MPRRSTAGRARRWTVGVVSCIGSGCSQIRSRRRHPPTIDAMAEPVPRFLADVDEAASRYNMCSICVAVCPTYRTNSLEWETASGRVAAVLDAIVDSIELRDIADGTLCTCLTCN